MNKKAYSYERFSLSRQRKGNSKSRQDSGYLSFCERHDRLPQELRFDDFGRSGAGAHLKGRLGEFLAMVKRGEIERGSMLVVESLDRLSRMEIDKGQDIIFELLRAGIDIGVVIPERIYTQISLKDPMCQVEWVMMLQRAYEDNIHKSERSFFNQTKLKLQARKDGLPVAKKCCPRWIKWSDEKNKWVIIKDRGNVIRLIFGWIEDGYSVTDVVRKLNQGGYKSFARLGLKKQKPIWTYSELLKLLHNRALIGEYQPKTYRKYVMTKPENHGPVNEGYYPAVISEERFEHIQALLQQRAPAHNGRRTGGDLEPPDKTDLDLVGE